MKPKQKNAALRWNMNHHPVNMLNTSQTVGVKMKDLKKMNSINNNVAKADKAE